MKSTVLKKIIKSAVKEAIQEELKDLLLEALRSSKSSPVVTPITEQHTPNISPTQTPITAQSNFSPEQMRTKYKEALDSTTLSFNSSNVQQFRPNPAVDVVNGSLPSGDVGMDQIAALMNSK